MLGLTVDDSFVRILDVIAIGMEWMVRYAMEELLLGDSMMIVIGDWNGAAVE